MGWLLEAFEDLTEIVFTLVVAGFLALLILVFILNFGKVTNFVFCLNGLICLFILIPLIAGLIYARDSYLGGGD